MRIIKEGKKPIKEWEVTCKKCGCISFRSKEVRAEQMAES